MSSSAEAIFRAALAAVDPAARTRAALAALAIEREVVLLSLGKAAATMARGARAALGSRIACEVVVAPVVEPGAPAGWMVGAHPVPDARSEAAGRALLEAAAAARADREVVALISGGGSAMAAVPARGLSLADKAGALAAIYAAGADIGELNTVRKHLSAIKGGQLAAASPAPVTTLVASDVVGDDLATVASGPTIPDATTFGDALAVAEARVGLATLPAPVRAHLEAGAAGRIADTPATARPGDRALCIAGVGAFADAAAAVAAASWQVEIVSRGLAGDVEDVCARFGDAACAAPPGRCLVAAGEATLALGPSPGRGGRAQHAALLLARRIAGRADLEILVAGSDGVDGNSDAAGAVVRGDTWDAVRAAGVDPDDALARRDSATALAAIGAQVVTGPTGVNHCDLLVALVR